MNQETRVGLFLIAAIGAIVGSVLMLGNIQIFRQTDRFFINFENVEALPPKAAVKVAGVEIGKVRRVALVKGRAQVTIDVDPDVKVYENAVARIGSTGIIGTKFVDLTPGSPPASVLEEGAVIEGLDAGSLNTMITRLTSLFETDPEHGNAVDNLKETIANIRNVSRSLDQAMGDHADDMEAIVVNVRELTQSAKVFAKHLEEISTERKEDVKVALEKFRGVGEKLDALLAKVQRGEGMLGAIVSDEKAGQDVKQAVASIKDTAESAKKVLGRFTLINTYWNYRYRYNFKDSEGASDVAVKFEPRPGKFYAIGATNVGKPESNEKNTVFERKNRIMAVMGQDFGPFTGYVGAIRSSGGAGLNFRPFHGNKDWGRRIELNAEVSDFSRDRVVKGERLDRAFVGLGGHVAVRRWLWVGARVEDVLERSAFMAYTNIIFRDEDLAYLLGFASFAR